MNVCTVILGAGKGSRMKSITPKPFHKVANLKLIDWVLNTLNSIKIDKKIIVTSKNINYSEYSKTNRIVIQNDHGKTRKKREELSISACKCIKKENLHAN